MRGFKKLSWLKAFCIFFNDYSWIIFPYDQMKHMVIYALVTTVKCNPGEGCNAGVLQILVNWNNILQFIFSGPLRSGEAIPHRATAIVQIAFSKGHTELCSHPRHPFQVWQIFLHSDSPCSLTSTQRIGRTFPWDSRGDVMCRRLMTGKISDPNPWPNVFQNFFKIMILPRRGSATHIRHICVLCKSHSTWFFGIVLWLLCQLKAHFNIRA